MYAHIYLIRHLASPEKNKWYSSFGRKKKMYYYSTTSTKPQFSLKKRNKKLSNYHLKKEKLIHNPGKILIKDIRQEIDSSDDLEENADYLDVEKKVDVLILDVEKEVDTLIHSKTMGKTNEL